MGTKTFTCRRCGKRKRINKLSKSGTAPRPACKQCLNEYQKDYAERNRRYKEWNVKKARAHGRALHALARKHDAEFQSLYRKALREVDSEPVLVQGSALRRSRERGQ